MTKIVGVDFGTTNVRIAEWDTDDDTPPSSCPIASGDTFAMPAVMALEQQDNGQIIYKFGEEADPLDGAPNTEVVRNIKRYMLLSDEHDRRNYEWELQQQGKSWPDWFDQNTNSIGIWNEIISLEEAIRLILKEAISRSGLTGQAAEWRAGCPVSSDLTYRNALLSALNELGCTGRIEWISEEPLLLLSLGKALGSLEDGLYIVYDLGGGSFDCAMVEIKDGKPVVLSEEGLTALGGMDIDEELRRLLDYNGGYDTLRTAKEQLAENNGVMSFAEENTLTRYTLTNAIVEEALDSLGFMDKTIATMVTAFKKGWILREATQDQTQAPMGWSACIAAMCSEVDKVLVVGGPTQMPYFGEKLASIFGADKIVTADDLTRNAGRGDIANPALTALSHGACYMHQNKYIPLAVDRIPARISIKVSDNFNTEEDIYEPFQRFPLNPSDPYEGSEVIRRVLYDDESTTLDGSKQAFFWIRVTSPDGDNLFNVGPLKMQMPRDNYTGPRADRIQLVIDRLGGVKVKLSAGPRELYNAFQSVLVVLPDPPWQPDLKAVQPYLERGRKYLGDTVYPVGGEAYITTLQAAYDDSQRRA